MKPLALCFCALAACSAACDGKVPAKVPAVAQAHVAAIKASALSNDWAKASLEYDKIEWQTIHQPAAVLLDISESLGSHDNARQLRREVKTKYLLLMDAGDPAMPDDIAPTPIMFTRLPVTDMPVAEIPAIVLPITGIPCVLVRDEAFLAAMALWEARYGKSLDYWDDHGNKIIPRPGTVLWAERKAVIAAVEAGGDYVALWDAYNAHFKQAVGRRINLQKKK
jgi:hypothetical protein